MGLLWPKCCGATTLPNYRYRSKLHQKSDEYKTQKIGNLRSETMTAKPKLTRSNKKKCLTETEKEQLRNNYNEKNFDTNPAKQQAWQESFLH